MITFPNRFTATICWTSLRGSHPTLPVSANPSRFGLVRREVRAVGVVEHHGADARLRVHHHALGQVHADFFGLQQRPEALLVIEVGTCGIPEAVPLAAVP